MPAWDCPGAVVAFDSRGINGRVFAVHLIGPIDRSGLLHIAQIPTDIEVAVFIGTQPWPLIDGPSVRFLPGELILFTSIQAPHHAVASLQDMLSSHRGWIPGYDPAQHISVSFVAHTWLMHDFGERLFLLHPDRRRQVRQDIATALNVPSRELVLQPAHLASPDFSHKGTAASTVLAALDSRDFLPSLQSRSVICFVDARPVLLNITWQVCPNRLLDTGSLAARFAGICPSGHAVHITSNDLAPVPLGVHLAVEDGEVFTIFFRPFHISPDHFPPPPDHPDDDDDDEGSHDGGDDNEGIQQIIPGGAQAGYSTRPADTGGTIHTYSDSGAYSAHSFVDKWSITLLHDAIPHGWWWITPVEAGYEGKGTWFAVCDSFLPPTTCRVLASRGPDFVQSSCWLTNSFGWGWNLVLNEQLVGVIGCCNGSTGL